MIKYEIGEKLNLMLPLYPLIDSFRLYVLKNKFLIKLYMLQKNKERFQNYFNRVIILAFYEHCKCTFKAYQQRLHYARSSVELFQKFLHGLMKPIIKHMPCILRLQEPYLRHHFGKNQYHVSTKFLAGNDNVQFYNFNMIERITSSQYSIPTSNFIGRNLISPQSKVKQPNYALMPCTLACKIPENWATRVFNGLKKFRANCSFTNMIEAFIDFENCRECNGNYNACKLGDDCLDHLNFLNKISVHYVEMRTIVRELYIVRNHITNYCKINKYILQGNNHGINKLKLFKENENRVANDKKNYQLDQIIKKITMSEADLEMYNKFFAAFHKNLEERLTLKSCNICFKFFKPTDLTKIPTSLTTRQKTVLRDISEKTNTNEQARICRNFCFADLFIKDRIPAYSILNNMYLDEIPDEIKLLNMYEKMLIQLGKVYQNITKLQVKSNIKIHNCIPALKGVSIHLPLTHKETNQYISDTLPNYDTLKIIIDSLPTKNSIVWRQLVNLGKVYDAINLLRKINPLYAHTQVLPKNNIKLYGIVKFVNKDSENGKVSDDPFVTVSSSIWNPRQFTCIDLDRVSKFDSDINKYSCVKNEQKPIYSNDVNLDHLCFPDIYPKGRGGMRDERQIEIKPAMYLRWAILNKNPVVRRNQQFIFSAFHNKDVRAADSGIFHHMNTTNFNKLTASEFLGKIKDDDKDVESRLHTVMNKVRNSKEYWNKVHSDLRAFNQAKGPAHFFLTLNPAEYNWQDLRQFIIQHSSDIPNAEMLDFNVLLNNEPGLVAYYFNQRFNAFFAKVLLISNSPLGNVSGYFWRREYQSRGAPHMHIKIWIENGPIIGIDKDEDVVNFIDKHITCRLPDQLLEPELYALVIKYQLHKCTDSCIRKRFTGHCSIKYCRYGFPKNVQGITCLNTVEDTLVAKRKSAGSKIYNLARKPNETMINDYNPLLLMLWEANMDIQFIGENTMALDKYITGYITKPEKNATTELWADCQKNASLRAQLKSYALKCFKSREAGIYEVFDKLLGFEMCDFSTKVTWINTFAKEKRRKSLLPKHLLENADPNSTNIFRNNTVDDYYPSRPPELEKTCFFEFCAKFDFVPKKCSESHTQCFTLFQRDASNSILGYLHKREFEKILNMAIIKCVDEDSTNEYFRQILFLFKPWRNENELKYTNETYIEAFERTQNAAKDNNESFDLARFDKFQFIRKRTERALEMAQRARAIKIDNHEPNNHANQQCVGVTDLVIERVDRNKLEMQIKNLNKEQGKVFYRVIKHIRHMEDHKNNKCKCNQIIKPLRLFCSGVAGNLLIFISND